MSPFKNKHIVAQCRLKGPYNLLNIDSSNGLLPDGSMPLP